ncbi:unnamed protein product [Rotaria sp. Silwood1]|nr:unnamed protein product [Rotaria sp. Silwood1]CAF1183006.1 unnamed protein product [Rotaria sp. Silwood1]CAF3463643.1 unnamed protein product [Rotaria sp. Silwood1]CAF4743304.1 unnamed protein product [Rotaria sp. Silwood1]
MQIAEQETLRKPVVPKETKPMQKLIPKASTVSTPRSIKQYYQNYFRIDYTILETVCKPNSMFNTTATIQSLEYLTNKKFNTITRNVTMNIISINVIITKINKTQQNSSPKFKKIVCNYDLELYIGFDFPSYCNAACQSEEIQHLTSRSRPFGNPVDSSFTFTLFSSKPFRTIANFNIQQVLIYRSSIYFNKKVYIGSFNETRYLSALILDSSASQTSITMSQTNRSLFLITNPLDQNSFENDCSTVFISISTVPGCDTYMRHENRRIKLGKNDQSILFKQDATFKLLTSKIKKDIVVFQSINIPESYISIDTDTNIALMLTQLEKSPSNIDSLDKRFLFKLNFNE